MNNLCRRNSDTPHDAAFVRPICKSHFAVSCANPRDHARIPRPHGHNPPQNNFMQLLSFRPSSIDLRTGMRSFASISIGASRFLTWHSASTCIMLRSRVFGLNRRRFLRFYDFLRCSIRHCCLLTDSIGSLPANPSRFVSIRAKSVRLAAQLSRSKFYAALRNDAHLGTLGDEVRCHPEGRSVRPPERSRTCSASSRPIQNHTSRFLKSNPISTRQPTERDPYWPQSTSCS